MNGMIQERRKTLIQDFNAQKVVIERMEAELAAAKVTLSRLEGALLLCDELLSKEPPAEVKKNDQASAGV